jgi:hypothetical protein
VPLNQASFADRAAVYVILCVAQGGNSTVLDVGQSGEVGSRVDDHDRRSCWIKECPSGNIWVCVHLMPSDRYTKEDRLALERTLRQQYQPPCGQR